MVYLVDGKLGRIPSHPDLTYAKQVALPVYSPEIDDTCPDHPDSPRFTTSGLCQACWKASQQHHPYS